ncbi:MAG: hypothetical protein KME25_32145 [Symplocastrum torsivum CPER-KK1]|uniref:Uncharacterized protein n=1 Tax=Symplocastrum torsivum CPER-KK1 TaxID=450513 RepID=A0A951PRZ6_9CYAN|nr:hypothetical protein [Symplocastrum torsivum CPER-KK1]
MPFKISVLTIGLIATPEATPPSPPVVQQKKYPLTCQWKGHREWCEEQAQNLCLLLK